MVKKKAAKEKEKFKEPDVTWNKSEARSLLYNDIVEGKVPLDATDADGRSTMLLRDIYLMHPQFADYDYEKFSSRLSSLRDAVTRSLLFEASSIHQLSLFSLFRAHSISATYH
jgi:hypothetical protein